MRICGHILAVFTVIVFGANAQRQTSELDAVNLKIQEVEQRLEAITYLKNYAVLNSIAELTNADVEQTVAILEQTKEKALVKAKKTSSGVLLYLLARVFISGCFRKAL